MGTSQVIYIIILLALFLGFYWYKVKKTGGTADYIKRQFGLAEDEHLVNVYNGNFHVDKGLGDVGMLLVGTERVGKTLQIAITNKERLILSFVGEKHEPYQFVRSEIKSIEIQETKKISEKAGTTIGRVLTVMTLNNGEEFKLDVDRVGVEAMQRWLQS
jgi:hypothetical protein